jgi:hypothetical protein
MLIKFSTAGLGRWIYIVKIEYQNKLVVGKKSDY